METRFVAKLGPDRWQSLFVATESADTTQARPQQEARLKNDPQVKALLGTIQAAGLIDEATVNSAMRTGAAMMPTLQAADLAFFAWINRYTQHVDRPRLLIP